MRQPKNTEKQKARKRAIITRNRGRWILLRLESPVLRRKYHKHCAARKTNMTADLNQYIKLVTQ